MPFGVRSHRERISTVDETTTDHRHVFAFALGGKPGQEPMPWTMTCRECGYSKHGDDARAELGMWFSSEPLGDSDATT